MIGANEARVNITYAGENADLPDPVSFDATDGDIRQWVTEAVRGGVGLIPAQVASFTDFVVERFPAPTDAVPGQRDFNLITIRPKTPFGG